MLGDRLAERLALLAVAQGQLQRPLGDPDAARRDVHAPDLQRVHHLHEPLAEAIRPTQDPVLRDLEPVEDELGGLDTLVAHLLDLGGNHESGELAGVLALDGDELVGTGLHRVGEFQQHPLPVGRGRIAP